MSAWIEIPLGVATSPSDFVALYMSAWIEMLKKVVKNPRTVVALYMSAWIEIAIYHHHSQISKSHSIWVRGLKFIGLLVMQVLTGRTLYECVDWNPCQPYSIAGKRVALYMSAWIEIYTKTSMPFLRQVALYMSAWIGMALYKHAQQHL